MATTLPRHFPVAPPLQDWENLRLTSVLDDGRNPREHWLDHDPRIAQQNRRTGLCTAGDTYAAMVCADGYLLELTAPAWLMAVIRDELPAPARPSGTYGFRQSYRLRIAAAEWITSQLCLPPPCVTRKEAAFRFGAAPLHRMLSDCELNWREFVALVEARATAAGALAASEAA